MHVHVAIVTHGHGTDWFWADSQNGLDKKLAKFCRYWWADMVGKRKKPKTDREVIDTYFAVSENNGVEVRETHDFVLPEFKHVAIKRWIREGELDGKDIGHTKELFSLVGRRLDKAYVQEIVGDCVFQAANGKFYEGAVEFILTEITPERAKELTPEDEE